MDDAELRRLAEAATGQDWSTAEYDMYLHGTQPPTILGLLDRLEAAEKDAARYRLLADRMIHVAHPAGAGWTMDEVLASGDRDLDEVIDAAIGIWTRRSMR